MSKLFGSLFKCILLSPEDTFVLKTFSCNASKFNKYIKNKCCPCPEVPEERPKIVRAKTCVQCTFWEPPRVQPVCVRGEKKIYPIAKGPCRAAIPTFCGEAVKRRKHKPKPKPCPQGYEKMKY